jgi:hypothetical protein
VCPRCNLRYCSLVCYKDLQHADCTESFYRDSVTAEIQQRDLDKDSKNKMLEMLKRLEEDNNPDDLLDSDDDYEDEHQEELMARFNNIDIENTDPDLIWDLLSDRERQEFEKVLSELEQTGDWNKMNLPSYQPWWKQHISLVQDQEETDTTTVPELPKMIPDFTKMTQPATRSSPHLAWNLLHILATYSYLMRHSMGDLLEDPEDTVALCEKVSANVLYSNAAECPFDSVGDVVADLVDGIFKIEDATDIAPRKKLNNLRHYDLRLLLLQDIELLLKECIRATHDFWQALNQITQIKKKNKKGVMLATRKLYFYLAAAGFLDRNRIEMIQLAIENETTKTKTEKEEFQRDFEAAQNAIKQQKQNTAKSGKIEEIS